MNEEEKAMMESFGITSESKIVYYYKQYRYENYKDALKYAQIDAKRTLENDPQTSE